MSAAESLAGGAAATLPVSVQGQSPTPHPDAALLALGSVLTEVWDCENRAWALAKGERCDDGPHTVLANGMCRRASEIAHLIAEASATTMEGLRVKMRAMAWCRSEEPITAKELGPFDSHPATETILLLSLLRDLDGEAVA